MHRKCTRSFRRPSWDNNLHSLFFVSFKSKKKTSCCQRRAAQYLCFAKFLTSFTNKGARQAQHEILFPASLDELFVQEAEQQHYLADNMCLLHSLERRQYVRHVSHLQRRETVGKRAKKGRKYISSYSRSGRDPRRRSLYCCPRNASIHPDRWHIMLSGSRPTCTQRQQQPPCLTRKRFWPYRWLLEWSWRRRGPLNIPNNPRYRPSEWQHRAA